jgi:hypothetical protein
MATGQISGVHFPHGSAKVAIAAEQQDMNFLTSLLHSARCHGGVSAALLVCIGVEGRRVVADLRTTEAAAKQCTNGPSVDRVRGLAAAS